MKGIEEFRLYYNHTIHPELVRLDRRRQRLLRLIFISSILLVGLIIFELYLDVFLVTLLLMIPVAIYISYLFFQVKKYKVAFKPKIMNLILEFMKEDKNYRSLKYDPKRYIPLQMFMASQIFGVQPAVYEGEDFIEGVTDEVKFELSELNVKEFSPVRSRLNYVFRGVFLHAELKEPINGFLIFLPRKFRQYLTRTLKIITANNGISVDNFIKDDDFREEYMTFATGKLKIKDILPDYLQSVFSQYAKQTGKDIYVSFNGNHIFIALTNQKDILEPKIFQSNVSFELMYEFFEDIQLIINIVEAFDRHY